MPHLEVNTCNIRVRSAVILAESDNFYFLKLRNRQFMDSGRVGDGDNRRTKEYLSDRRLGR